MRERGSGQRALRCEATGRLLAGLWEGSWVLTEGCTVTTALIGGYGSLRSCTGFSPGAQPRALPGGLSSVRRGFIPLSLCCVATVLLAVLPGWALGELQGGLRSVEGLVVGPLVLSS